jgi:hypothetical protein
MTWIARYVDRARQKPDYFRTIHADSLNEAIKIAELYTRKGYLFLSTKQKRGAVQ